MIQTELIKTALTALKSNKVRTFLTMLGIIIGVYAVITLVSLVKGVQNYVTDQFNSLGTNIVFIMPGRGAIGNDPAVSFTDNKLEMKHSDLLHNKNTAIVSGVSPFSTAGMTAKYRGKKYFATVVGSNANFMSIFNLKLSDGVFFTEVQEQAADKIVILGASAKDKLFDGRKAVGEFIKINDKSFEVIGVMEPKSPDFDDEIVLPFSTAKTSLSLDNIAYIAVQLKKDVDVKLAIKQIELTLLSDLKKDDFTVMDQADLLSSIQSIIQIISIALGGIAAISLLVGGIGIMNIMLVAVNERVREIGLRKALGATPSLIATQFLIEASFLGLTGGIVGTILGYATTLISRKFIRTEIPFWALAMSLGFSLFVGLIFGTYPAYKASKKSPIEALRYE